MRGRARRRVGSELQAGRLWLTSGKGSCRGELGRGRSADRTGSKTCRADASICERLGPKREAINETCASFGRVGLVATLAVSPFTFPSEAGRGVDGLRGRATGWPAAKPHAAFASASGFCQPMQAAVCRALSLCFFAFHTPRNCARVHREDVRSVFFACPDLCQVSPRPCAVCHSNR
jgi:hypothetical protein